MNQDDFFTRCTAPAGKSLIGGSTGSGKSCLVMDLVVKFLHQNYRADLDCGALNDLHAILNDQIPVVIITDEARWPLLLKLSDNCLPDPELSEETKLTRMDNLCRIVNYPQDSANDRSEWLAQWESFLARHQVRLLILDGSWPEMDPKILLRWARSYNLAVVQTAQNRRAAPGYSGSKAFMGPINNLTTSDLAVMLSEPVKNQQNYLKFEVTVLKDRQGLSGQGQEFIYECNYSPY
jgi:hypothetical protein